MSIQANSENCGSPLGNKFDLEVGQRSPSRSWHGITRKVLSQGTHMPSIKALSVIVQKLWPRLKFLWQTDDRQTDRQRDRRTNEILCPHDFAKAGDNNIENVEVWWGCFKILGYFNNVSVISQLGSRIFQISEIKVLRLGFKIRTPCSQAKSLTTPPLPLPETVEKD